MIILNKKDKKVAREAIEKGVLAEYNVSLEKAETIIKEWRSKSLDTTKAYHRLIKTIEQQDTDIGKRYDGLTGSRYLETVAVILYDGYITEEDINDLSPEVKQVVNRWISF